MVFVYFPHLLNHWSLQPLVRDSIRCSSQSSHRISYSFPLSPQATWNCHPGGPPPHTGSHHNTARVVHHLEATLRGKKWDAWVTLKKGASFPSLGTWRGGSLWGSVLLLKQHDHRSDCCWEPCGLWPLLYWDAVSSLYLVNWTKMEVDHGSLLLCVGQGGCSCYQPFEGGDQFDVTSGCIFRSWKLKSTFAWKSLNFGALGKGYY